MKLLEVLKLVDGQTKSFYLTLNPYFSSPMMVTLLFFQKTLHDPGPPSREKILTTDVPT